MRADDEVADDGQRDSNLPQQFKSTGHNTALEKIAEHVAILVMEDEGTVEDLEPDTLCLHLLRLHIEVRKWPVLKCSDE